MAIVPIFKVREVSYN